MSFEYTAEDIKRDNPIVDVVKSYGIDLKPTGGKDLVALCPLHKEKTPSFYVSPDKNQGVFYCQGCNQGGDVITFVAKMDGIDVGAAMKKLTPERHQSQTKAAPAAKVRRESEVQATAALRDGEIVATYNYTDETGKLLYQAIRYNPKTFKQRQPDGNGGWKWTMEGAVRVLYKLPKVLKNQFVWIVEGEKDADNINNLGMCATCNVGGAGKWMEPYTDSLKGKDIIICGDNDEPGQKHVQLVLQSLAGKVATVRVVKVPAPHKDVSDYLVTFEQSMTADQKAQKLFDSLVNDAAVLTKGLNLPIYNMAQLEQKYVESIRQSDSILLNLGRWLPALGWKVRPIVPGELITFIADTGVGKTMLLQNLSMHAAPLETLFFQFELPEQTMFERYVSLSNKVSGEDVFNAYKKEMAIDWRRTRKLDHVYVCPESGITPEQVESYIIQSELLIGAKPKLVCIDYIQLMQGKGKRYERVSDAAEAMRIIAKRRNLIIAIASQVSRPDGEEPEVFLHDAKESGAIENSSSLVLGCWRDKEESSTLWVKVLKNSKGRGAGFVKVKCNIDDTLTISELTEPKITAEDTI